MAKKLMIFGSYVTDLCSRSDRFPEAGETIKGISFRTGPGGKGSNQAIAAHRAGADLTFVTRLGDDPLGQEAMRFYRAEGLDTDKIIVEAGGDTGAAMIMVDEGTAQNRIIVIGGACGRFTADEIEALKPAAAQSEIFLTQLETNLEPVYALLKAAHDGGAHTVLDPAPACRVDPSLWQYVDTVKPNETEAEFFTGIKVESFDDAARAADVFRGFGVKNVIITLGERGAYVRCGDEARCIPAAKCGKTVDTTGAGDAFSGGFAAALAEGMDFFEAAGFASAVAGLCVTKPGTAPAMPYRDEIEAFLNNGKRTACPESALDAVSGGRIGFEKTVGLTGTAVYGKDAQPSGKAD